jgi:hypothetical protein
MFTKNKNEKLSPLQDKPLRNPGQSLEKEIDRVINDQVSTRLIMAMMMVVFAGMEWYRFYQELPPTPGLFTVAAVVLVVYAVWYLLKARKKIKNLRLGLEGEKAVGQFLERLRAQGCDVYHDVVTDNFNLDHVVVSKKGVFVIETKTYSKTKGVDNKIGFRDGKLFINGHESKSNPVKQSLGAAKWLEEQLESSTGAKIPVNSFIVFPGWFVEPHANKGRNKGLIVNPKVLPTFIDKMPEKLRQDEMKMASYHLSRYIRFNETLLEKQ